jgi:hypothetical protein
VWYRWYRGYRGRGIEGGGIGPRGRAEGIWDESGEERGL